jgi:hypothetical protein
MDFDSGYSPRPVAVLMRGQPEHSTGSRCNAFFEQARVSEYEFLVDAVNDFSGQYDLAAEPCIDEAFDHFAAHQSQGDVCFL